MTDHHYVGPARPTSGAWRLEVLPTPDHERWPMWGLSKAGEALREAVVSFRSALVETLEGDWLEDGEEGPAVLDDALPEAEIALALVGLECLRRQIDLELALLIAQGLNFDLSWHQMAGLVGVSRQALHKRYAEKVQRLEAAAAASSALRMDDLSDLAASTDSRPDLDPLRRLLEKIGRESSADAANDPD